MTKLQFFKDTLNKFLELKKRNDTYDEMSNKILSNEMTKDFPVYLSDNFCFPYETLVLESLAQLWNDPESVKEWIEYLIYETIDSKDKNRFNVWDINDEKEETKKYKIYDVDGLCEYLLDNYKLLGE